MYATSVDFRVPLKSFSGSFLAKQLHVCECVLYLTTILSPSFLTWSFSSHQLVHEAEVIWVEIDTTTMEVELPRMFVFPTSCVVLRYKVAKLCLKTSKFSNTEIIRICLFLSLSLKFYQKYQREISHSLQNLRKNDILSTNFIENEEELCVKKVLIFENSYEQ